MKEKIDIFSDLLCVSFNSLIKSRRFPKNLKLTDITPLHKKGKKDIKGNYMPVSIFPNFLNIFEKRIFTQMSQFFNNIISKYQCGFQKNFSTQQCRLDMLDLNRKAFGALLTDLTKAFDCLDHELLIAKLNACGFSLPALKLIHSYLSNKKQRIKINSSYISWHDIIFRVPL